MISCLNLDNNKKVNNRLFRGRRKDGVSKLHDTCHSGKGRTTLCYKMNRPKHPQAHLPFPSLYSSVCPRLGFSFPSFYSLTFIYIQFLYALLLSSLSKQYATFSTILLPFGWCFVRSLCASGRVGTSCRTHPEVRHSTSEARWTGSKYPWPNCTSDFILPVNQHTEMSISCSICNSI